MLFARFSNATKSAVRCHKILMANWHISDNFLRKDVHYLYFAPKSHCTEQAFSQISHSVISFAAIDGYVFWTNDLLGLSAVFM